MAGHQPVQAQEEWRVTCSGHAVDTQWTCSGAARPRPPGDTHVHRGWIKTRQDTQKASHCPSGRDDGKMACRHSLKEITKKREARERESETRRCLSPSNGRRPRRRRRRRLIAVSLPPNRQSNINYNPWGRYCPGQESRRRHAGGPPGKVKAKEDRGSLATWTGCKISQF